MNKRETRKKIRKHLSSKGKKCDFVVTEFLVMYWWRLLNVAVFDGILPQPNKLIIRNFRDYTYGFCDGNTAEDYYLGFRRTYESRKMFLIVLVHEMVHSHEIIKYGKMTHGRTFFEWEDIISKRVGLPLTRMIDESIFEQAA